MKFIECESKSEEIMTLILSHDRTDKAGVKVLGINRKLRNDKQRTVP